MSKSNQSIVDMFDAQTRANVESGFINQQLTGIHNAFVHGEAFTKAGYRVSDEQLEKLFVHLDEFKKIVRDITSR